MPLNLARWGAALALGFMVTMAGACDDGGPAGTARVRVQLTDAPSDFIASAEVWISRVYLKPGEDSGEATDLFNDSKNPRSYDLLMLRDGVTADLTGAMPVEPGNYRQLRLVVDSAFVTLAEGFTFSDGTSTRSLKVPSGAQSGIKVQLAKPIEAEEGETQSLVVDFDVDRNFVIQGNPNGSAGISGILFTPLLNEKSRRSSDDS
jgi:hypothetical protein